MSWDCDILQHLIDKEADFTQENSLVYACFGKEPDAVKMLLAAGAPVSPGNERALLWAVWPCPNTGPRPEQVSMMVEMLLDAGAEPRCPEGMWSVLHCTDVYAFKPSEAHAALLRLLEVDPGLLESRDYASRTPLMCALLRSKAKVAEFLLSVGADVHATDSEGRSVLMYMQASQESLDAWALPALIDAGADPTHCDCTQQTALHIAVEGEAPTPRNGDDTRVYLYHDEDVSLHVAALCEAVLNRPASARWVGMRWRVDNREDDREPKRQRRC
jgi:ankyrin repeat protein